MAILCQANAARASAPAWVLIPSGWFGMGSDRGQDNERPRHRVWVNAFYLAEHQVTNREYAMFLEACDVAPSPMWRDPNFSDPNQPVVAVSWFDAVLYCHWLGRAIGRKCRLPTEAEWERAARGGMEDQEFPWGNDPPQSRPSYGNRWRSGPEPVGQSPPNAFGVYEICENVHEWCSDWYQADYYAISPGRNPPGPESGSRRSSRGGSWRHHIKIARCAARSSIPPDFRYADYGFRVASDCD
jgi:formylglycine-generating enzyme required for sulfatase activity